MSHINDMTVPGSILVFLPGWNWIFALHRFLEEHPVFGLSAYVLEAIVSILHLIL